MRRDPRLHRLDEIALSDIGPSGAFPILRDLLTEDATKFARRAFIALQDVVLRIASDRATGAETQAWQDVCARTSVLMREGGAESIADEVRALASLVERKASFLEAQPIAELLRRRHVPDVLRMLASQPNPTNRASVLEATGLGQSNLSRLITMLELHGLVRREKAGRDTGLLLTDAGKAVASELKRANDPVAPEIVWEARGIGICVIDKNGAVSRANKGFEEAVGTPAELAVVSVGADSGPQDVSTEEGRWVRRVGIGEVEGGTASVWVDVSDLRAALADAERRAAAAEAQAAGIRVALAEAQIAAASAENRLRRQQLAVEAVRDRAVGRLGNMAKIVHEALPLKQRAMARPDHQITAIKDAISKLLNVPSFSFRHEQASYKDGVSLFENVIRSTHALTNAKVVIEYPDWFRAEKADYGPLIEPLTQVLLSGYEDVQMNLERNESFVFLHFIVHQPLNRPGPFTIIDAETAQSFFHAWEHVGVDVWTEPSTNHGVVSFCMSLARKVGSPWDIDR